MGKCPQCENDIVVNTFDNKCGFANKLVITLCDVAMNLNMTAPVTRINNTVTNENLLSSYIDTARAAMKIAAQEMREHTAGEEMREHTAGEEIREHTAGEEIREHTAGEENERTYCW